MLPKMLPEVAFSNTFSDTFWIISPSHPPIHLTLTPSCMTYPNLVPYPPGNPHSLPASYPPSLPSHPPSLPPSLPSTLPPLPPSLPSTLPPSHPPHIPPIPPYPHHISPIQAYTYQQAKIMENNSLWEVIWS